MRPRVRIGISANFFHADPMRALFKGKTLEYLEQEMGRACWRAGAVPYMLPDLGHAEGAAEVLEITDGLVLSGGADMAPGSYGESPIDERWPGDPIRDAYEVRLVHAALEAGLPVLGVCRGAQVLNVALGGTLYQDIKTQVEDSLVHRDWEPYDALSHSVTLEQDSFVAAVYGGAGSLVVNSIHHQGLKDVGEGLRVTARAPDGIVEAVERTTEATWAVGLQWHPEWLPARPSHAAVREAATQDRASGDAVFAAFVQVCRERRRARP